VGKRKFGPVGDKAQAVNLILLLGPTAAGKTRLAAQAAVRIGGEIISADSRQVYRGMDIGTGKDYADYQVAGQTISHHLIDIAEPGEEYNVYRFQQDFIDAFAAISGRGKMPVLCGGTGLYLEAVLRGYRLLEVPENPALLEKLNALPLEALVQQLVALRPLHNTTDTQNRERTIRAIEIARYEAAHADRLHDFPEIRPRVFGVRWERQALKRRITQRLRHRLRHGMIEEVRQLLDSGLTPQQLQFYGLEYKFVTLYLTGRLRYNDMFQKLNAAIHRFAKRQMTWFRKMERQGHAIRWIEGRWPLEQQVEAMLYELGGVKH